MKGPCYKGQLSDGSSTAGYSEPRNYNINFAGNSGIPAKLMPGLLINDDIFVTDSAPYHFYCHTILSLVHIFEHEASQGGYWWTVIQLFD